MGMRVAYSTGFWCTNIGNAFYSLGVEYVLKQILGETNVTVISDYQTYTNGYGKRLYPDNNQLEFISKLDVDYIVLAGPVISKYFLRLWKDILISLEKRGIRYIILSAGMMKMTEDALKECMTFFKEHPPYILVSRDFETFSSFGEFADKSYNGICFSFFAPEFYSPAKLNENYMTFNFDKILEPYIWADNCNEAVAFEFDGKYYHVNNKGLFTKIATKTDRFSDALIYAISVFYHKKRVNYIDNKAIYRTDHRFHPHYRTKIYGQGNTFCADLPYGYLNIYANSELTLSDRVHACAVTLAYGHPAMLFARTNRVGLLDRVGASDISKHPVMIDMDWLSQEKKNMFCWLRDNLKESRMV